MKTRGQKTPAAGLDGHDDGCVTPKGAFVFTRVLLTHAWIIPAHSRITLGSLPDHSWIISGSLPDHEGPFLFFSSARSSAVKRIIAFTVPPCPAARR